MCEIKIVEYKESLAEKVAQMWNESADGWGGGDTIKTGEDVARSEAGSENINLYLAMEGDMVVGYCGLSEYKFDEDTMYIPLLNVRPTHHGKKIGKKLLLTALDRVIELGWPRLDLFTWPGNTKAVPLYKKCGFFWEEMDQSTHLMNFIPTVLKTEATKDYFKTMDWYNDCTRTIEVQPDGIKENKFEYYEYTWEKESKNLRVQFERKGRGIRLIETDEYLISATVEKLNLVFGRKYEVEYKVINKTGNPMNIEIEGMTNKNVDNTFYASKEVEGETIIKNQFFVAEITEEQNDFKTHPKVAAKIKVDGKEAIYQVGINPLFPCKLAFNGNKELCYLNQQGSFSLDIKNEFDEKATFSLKIPSNELVQISKTELTVQLEGNEGKSVPLNYVLKDFGFYYPQLEVEVTLGNDENIEFSKKVGYPFKGLNAKFFGESDKYWEMYNDKFILALEKLDNWQIPTRNKDDGEITAFLPPKLGKPFYDEFAKKSPENFNFYIDGATAVLEYTFKSDKKKDIHLKTSHKLHQNGILETIYEIINLSDVTSEEIFFCSPILHNIGRGVLPHKDGIVELDDSIGADYSYWDSKDIKENWIFAKSKEIPRGLCWPKEFELEFRGWHLALTQNIGKVPGKSSVKTGPIYVSVGAFSKWQEFRAFALKEEQVANPITKESIILEVNGGNPFVDNKVGIRVKEIKTPYLDGDITIQLGEEIQNKKIQQQEKLKEAYFELESSNTMDYVKAVLDLASFEFIKKRAIFTKGKGQIKESIIEKEGHKVFVADNGLIKIKSAPTFAANIFSLEYQGQEWLDSSFPKVKAKSWWSPWQGGIFSRPDGMIVRSIQNEETSAEFVGIKDRFNNEWSGIKVTVKIVKHEKFKGMTYHQYFLMLPNVPIVCQFAEIEQNTGKYLGVNWVESGFFKVDEDINSCYLKYQNTNGDWAKVKAGVGGFDGNPYSTVSVESKNNKNLIHFISDIQIKKQTVSVNKEVIFLNDTERFELENGGKVLTTPNFVVVADQRIDELALKDLLNLRF